MEGQYQCVEEYLGHLKLVDLRVSHLDQASGLSRCGLEHRIVSRFLLERKTQYVGGR